MFIPLNNFLKQGIVNRFAFVLPDRIVSAGHDISDGGLISCLLEMAFAGNRGIDIELSSQGSEGL